MGLLLSSSAICLATKLKKDSQKKFDLANKAYTEAEAALKKAKRNEKAAAQEMDTASQAFVKSGLAPLHTPYLGGARPFVSFHPAWNPNMFHPESAAMYSGRFRADPVLSPYGMTPDQYNFSPTAVMGLSAANTGLNLGGQAYGAAAKQQAQTGSASAAESSAASSESSATASDSK